MAIHYKQFCALARAAEVLGERWTLLIIRELLLGPKRFSDLRENLVELSSSVLTERLGRLVQSGVVYRYALPPPAASLVYALTEHGRALEQPLLALIRWGTRLLLPRRPREKLDPRWLRLTLLACARKARTPSHSFSLRVSNGGENVEIWVGGGARGTQVAETGPRADVTISADPEAILALMSGSLSPEDALASSRIRASGNLNCLAELPQLFEVAL